MKTILLCLTLFFSSLFHSAYSQNLSNFYKINGSDASNKANYNLTTLNAVTKTVELESTSDEIIDIRFSMAVPKPFSKGAVLKLQIGRNQVLDINLLFDNTDASSCQYNGDEIEYSDFAYSRNDDNEKSEMTLSFSLRIAKNNVKIFYHDNMKGVISEPFSIDSRDISLKMTTQGGATMKVEVDTDYLNHLSCFADDGLEIRKTEDLNGQSIGSIPFGKKVYVLENMDSEILENPMGTNTKGNLKVGDVSSRMVKVMYGNKIGYAFGGFLFPINRVNSFDIRPVNVKGWNLKDIEGEEIFYQKEQVYQQVTIPFRKDKYSLMDDSQRNLLLLKLFPDDTTLVNLKEWCQNNAAHKGRFDNFKYSRERNGFTEIYNVGVTEGKVRYFKYEKTSKDFLKRIATPSTAYVFANQLDLHSSIDTNSPVIAQIPIGEQLTILNTEVSEFMVIENIHGKMTKVNYKNQAGYVFDAYLSPIPLLEKTSALPLKEMGKQFSQLIQKRGFAEWKYRNLSEDAPSVTCLIVPSRDKFQAIQTLRQFYPSIDDLVFSWELEESSYLYDDNELEYLYHIFSYNQLADISTDYDSWVMTESKFVGGDSIRIKIQTIMEHLQLVSFSYEAED